MLVGDRGMITQARIDADLEPAGFDWITALRAPTIQALAAEGPLQLSLFDERDMAEIASDDYPGERLIVCRNPELAAERARKRAELIDATEKAVSVRVRRADLPSETSQSIYDRMSSERQREAKELRAQGFEWAQKIQAAADRERTTMLADAEQQSTITRGEGEAEADKVVAEAYDHDRDFFRLDRRLQAYRQSLAQPNSTVLLSPGSEFLHLFETGPTPTTPWK